MCIRKFYRHTCCNSLKDKPVIELCSASTGKIAGSCKKGLDTKVIATEDPAFGTSVICKVCNRQLTITMLLAKARKVEEDVIIEHAVMRSKEITQEKPLPKARIKLEQMKKNMLDRYFDAVKECSIQTKTCYNLRNNLAKESNIKGFEQARQRLAEAEAYAKIMRLFVRGMYKRWNGGSTEGIDEYLELKPEGDSENPASKEEQLQDQEPVQSAESTPKKPQK